MGAGQGVASPELGSDSGKPQETESRTQLHQLVLGNQLPMVKLAHVPAAPRPPPRPLSKGHAALFAFQPPCPLPGAVGRPPSLWDFETLASSGGSPAAFAVIGFLCGNGVWGILITLPLRWALFRLGLRPTSQAALPFSRSCQHPGPEEGMAGVGRLGT